MKFIKLLLSTFLFMTLQQTTNAQSGNWAKAGNSLSGTEKLGSTNAKPVRFFSNNVQRMTLDVNGNLGIGTTTPEGNLHIFRGSAGTVTANAKSLLVVENNDDNFINLLTPATKKSAILFGTPTLAEDGGIIYNNPVVPRGLQFNTANNTAMTLTSAGQLGIGTTAPKSNLHVFGGNSGVTPFGNATIVAEGSGDNFINVLAPSTNASGILFGNGQSNQDGAIVFNNALAKRGIQFNTTSITRMTLTSTGFLGVGTQAPASELHIFHGDGNTHGLRLQNSFSGGKSWTIFGIVDGNLGLAFNNITKGIFNAASGAYSTISDQRLKKDIEPAADVMDKVMQLQVKKYHFLDNKPSDNKDFGMIAQDVAKLFPEVVTHVKEKGEDFYTVNYSAYGVIALKAIQEQQKKIETLEERIEKLEAALNHSTATNTSNHLTSTFVKEGTDNALAQNQPNPFSQSTAIRYQLPQGSSGQLHIYDINGVLVKSVKAENRQTVINAGDLKSGTYTYTLSVDGTVIGSKKMVVVKQ